MVRLGDGPKVSALEALDEILHEVLDPEDPEDEEAPEERPKAIEKSEKLQKPVDRKLEDRSRPDVDVLEQLKEQIETQSWRDYMKAARKARDARKLEEKFKKYGPFKDFFMREDTQHVLTKIDNAWNVDNIVLISPIMSVSNAVIILFMAHRGNMGTFPFGMLVCLLLGVHPHLVVFGLLGLKLLQGRAKPKPKGTEGKGKGAVPRWPPPLCRAAARAGKVYRDLAPKRLAQAAAKQQQRQQQQALAKLAKEAKEGDGAEEVAGKQAEEAEEAAKELWAELAELAGRAAREELDTAASGGRADLLGASFPLAGAAAFPATEVDFVVVGSDLGALFTAAILARTGQQVLVVEPEADLGHGCLVSSDGLDFVLGDGCTLPGGPEGATFANLLAALAPPIPPALAQARQPPPAAKSGWGLAAARSAVGGLVGREPASGGTAPFPAAPPGLPPALPWSVEWARVGGARGVSLAVSIDGGRPVLWGADLASVRAELKACGADPPNGALLGFIKAMKDAKSLAKFAATRLPPKPAASQSATDKLLAGAGLDSNGAQNAGAQAAGAEGSAFDTLLSWSADSGLTSPNLVGGLCAPLLKRHPALWQVAVGLGVARENVSPLRLSYGCLAAQVASMLEGKLFPAGGPGSVAKQLYPAIALTGGAVVKCKLEGLVLSKDPGTEGAPAFCGGKAWRCGGVRLGEGRVVKARRGVVSGLGLHRTVNELLGGQGQGQGGDTASSGGGGGGWGASASASPWLDKCARALPRARAVVHILVCLRGTAEELGLFGADYVEVPPLVDERAEVLLPDKGGAGCAADLHKWMQVSFPSAKDPAWAAKHPGRSTCVITVEADPKEEKFESENKNKFERLNPGREDRLVKRLVERFPLLEGKVESVRTMKPDAHFRGLTTATAAYPAPVAPPAPAPAPAAAAPGAAPGAAAEAAPRSTASLPAVGTEAAAPGAAPAPSGALRLAPTTDVHGLWLGGRDLAGCLPGLAGGLTGGWLAAHAALGYDAVDAKVYGRNAVEEILEHQK